MLQHLVVVAVVEDHDAAVLPLPRNAPRPSRARLPDSPFALIIGSDPHRLDGDGDGDGYDGAPRHLDAGVSGWRSRAARRRGNNDLNDSP